MTGYTVHTGSTEKFAAGWDLIFNQPGTGRKKAPAKSVAAKTGAKAARKRGTGAARRTKSKTRKGR